jgi:hypothetical protein
MAARLEKNMEECAGGGRVRVRGGDLWNLLQGVRELGWGKNYNFIVTYL